MDYRQIALEKLLNDRVEKIKLGIYKWRGIHYQVLPYKQIKKGFSQFNKLKGKTTFGYRELSEKMKDKLC